VTIYSVDYRAVLNLIVIRAKVTVAINTDVMGTHPNLSRPILYDYYISNINWRLRNVLHWKNIPYDTVIVDLEKGQQFSQEFRKINPMCKLPVMYIDGHYLTESVAIAEYLEETCPQSPIFPKDAFQKAQVRQVVEIINSFCAPLQNSTVAKRYSDDPQEQLAWQLEFSTKGLLALEALLGQTSGKYCVGNEVTFADMALVPQIFCTRKLTADFSLYPKMMQIYSELLILEPFQKAHALNQDACPKENRMNYR
jgi:maleylacetoacetate isomerase